MRTIRLLTVGNSFADNALTYLEALAASAAGDVRVESARANLGGCSLEKHANLARYTATHPEYKPYNVGPCAATGAARGMTLQEALAAAPWDFVTLQQVSTHSWRPESFQPFLGELHALVRERAPRAEILLHQTWAYRSDSPFLPENGLTQALMFARIREAYRQHGALLKCRVLPSGEAVQRARETPGRTFAWPEPDYAYRQAVAPALPRQEHSLAVGWHWGINNTPDGIPALRLDANHLDARGCYLAGAVWLECLTGVDARTATLVPDGFEAADAAFLRAAAHDTVVASWQGGRP